MNSNLELVKLRLIANVIVDWCNIKAKENLISFDSAFVSSYKKFRFTTPTSEKIFSSTNDKKGYWAKGIYSLYEIFNDDGNISVSLLVSPKDIKDINRLQSFLKFNMIENYSDFIKIKTWNIFSTNNKLDDLPKILEHFFFNELHQYEKEVSKWLNNDKYTMFDNDYDLVEGAIRNISLDKYERNKEARKKCIEFHGSKCKICGFDFGKIYGSNFEGKIEVHHIKPLSEIKEEYVVDPINDLIPVCPNCHLILHCKEDGVYSPEEVKQFINSK